MMPKQLRLGNYIEYAGVICEVEEIHKKTITTNGVNAPISSFLSIPLTEEWLLSFGFEYYPSKREKRTFRKGKLQIVLSGNYIYPNGRTYYKSWCIIESQPKTVHQLQNLYFALTGEELTIKQTESI